MKKALSCAALGFGVLFLSTSAVFVRLAQAPSAITALYRLLFALLFLLPFVLLNPARRRELLRMPRKKQALSLLAGVLLAVHYILWFESLRHTSVASSTVLVTLQPLFTILFTFLFLHQRQNRLALLGCAIALAGSFVIGLGDMKAGPGSLPGDAMALAAAALISLYFFIGQDLRRDTSASVYSVLGYGGSVVFLALYALARGDPFWGYPALTWKAFWGLALVSTILGQFVFNLLLRWVPATSVSMSILGEPVGTCILARLILHESITLQQAAGMAIILGGLALYFLSGPLLSRRRGSR